MTTESAEQTYDLELLAGSQKAWERSDGLRAVYGNMYEAIRSRCVEGATLELGAGIGVSRAFFKDLVTSDVVKTPYVDRAMSAYAIEAGEAGAWANIFAIDVLHHLMRPMDFFGSAARALQPGGRIILVEPAATFGGKAFYSLFHHEPIQPQRVAPPFEFEANGVDGEFANMGMGVGLFRDHRALIDAQLAVHGLHIAQVTFRDAFAYPLTGGYSKPQLLPTIALQGLLKLEQYLPQWFYRLFGLRMVAVLEKINDDA
jgi:SAM-dependent methyltransferase